MTLTRADVQRLADSPPQGSGATTAPLATDMLGEASIPTIGADI